MTKELQKVEPVEMDVINDYLTSFGNTLKPHHRKQFIEICRGFNLNPFKREVYGIQYGQNFNIIVGYEVYLKRAEMTHQLAGWKVWTEGSGAALIAKIEIERHDWKKPFVHEVELCEYDQGNTMWKKKTKTMLKKVVTAQGFRLAFPSEFGGMPYTSDELPDKMTTPAPTIENESEVSVVTGKPLPPVDNSRRLELSKMVLEMKYGVITEAQTYIKKVTSFYINGEKREGKESLRDVSDKQLAKIEPRMRADYDDWRAREEKAPLPEIQSKDL